MSPIPISIPAVPHRRPVKSPSFPAAPPSSISIDLRDPQPPLDSIIICFLLVFLFFKFLLPSFTKFGLWIIHLTSEGGDLKTPQQTKRKLRTSADLGIGPMDDNDFGSLARDFGFRPQGKSAPMAMRSSSSSSSKSSWSSTPPPKPHDAAPLFSNPTLDAPPPPSRWSTDFAYNSVFDASKIDPAKSSSSALPVYDKPVYDDDIFEGVPGMKSASAVNYDDVFASNSSASPYDDLLGGLTKGAADRKAASGKSDPVLQSSSGFDDLIPGFRGSSGGSKSRDSVENKLVRPSSVSSTKSTVSHSEDPFVIFGSASSSAYPSSGLFTEPKEPTNNLDISNSSKADNSSGTGGIFDNIDGFDGFPNIKEKSSSTGNQHIDSFNASRHHTDKPLSRGKDSNSFLFDMPTNVSDAQGFANGAKSSPSVSADFVETNAHDGVSSLSNQYSENVEEIWLTVSEVPLFTQPTGALPPARPAPNRPVSSAGLSRKKNSYDSVNNPPISSIDELEELSSGRAPQTPSDGWSDMLSTSEDVEANFAAAASAAAMKEAMDRAEAKFKHAKEVREREKDAKAAKSRDSTRTNGDEKGTQDNIPRENHINQDWLEKEKREREEKEKEHRKIEREREEREKARRAVEMATREARERAAAEARLRAERAAVEKATNEARLRAERAAVQKAAAEALERAAAEARERVAAEARERSAVEAREKAAAEAKERAEKAAAEARERAEKEKQARERAAVERAAAEVRLRAERAALERVQAGAREREAAAARERMQKNENDLESFFGMSARPNSAPRQRTTSDPFDSQFHMKSADVARTSVGTSSNMRKATSTANIVDDLSSIFGAATSSAEFQELEGESEDRRKARYDRHLRTRERAAKALAEKNERDIQTQREQEERHKIAETMDIEIKRWAFGKEGNLRALLSTLQYVLWPECGWQPVSLTDLITGASVKKVYRKATLCIHPDKVQQKGATLRQKYIAEKVFDLLKEAWNKFNSEELF